MDTQKIVLSEVTKALRLARRYRGKFAADEAEYAEALLDDLESSNPSDDMKPLDPLSRW